MRRYKARNSSTPDKPCPATTKRTPVRPTVTVSNGNPRLGSLARGCYLSPIEMLLDRQLDRCVYGPGELLTPLRAIAAGWHPIGMSVHRLSPIIIVTMTILYATWITVARRKIIATMIDCAATDAPLASRLVDNEPLQTRAKRAGLTQKTLAALLGVTENTASMQLRGKWKSGTPGYVFAMLDAWEMLTHEQRQEMLDRVSKR
jgi:hypothetical protein